jgi:hypothetical protein
MLTFSDRMDRVLTRTIGHFGRTETHPKGACTYKRAGFPSFEIRGILDIEHHLESINIGQYYGVTFRLADFNEDIPLAASVDVKFSNIPTNGSMVTLDGETYTIRTSITDGTPNDVAKGSNYSDSARNLAEAINATPAGAGTRYSSATIEHPTCRAQWDGDAICRVFYRTAGIAGNGKIARDQGTNFSLSSTIFTGGGPLKADEVTIDGLTYKVTDIGNDAEGAVTLQLHL